MTSSNVIALDGLSKRYGERVGVADLSLHVPEGSVFGFIGPNGAGKTTAIRILLGFLRPNGGSARVFGLDCWRESHVVKRDVGYLPGDLRLHSWMTGREALTITGRGRGLDLRVKGSELADYLELDLTVTVRAMSRGMRQKLGLTLALAHEPRLLVLDEPTTGLDPITQGRLYQHLRDLARRGHTIFFSSHVLSEVEDLCDRVAIIRRGRLVADELLATLRERAERRVVVQWADGATPDPGEAPLFLTVHEAHGSKWLCSLDGASPELLAWLQGRPVRDVIIEPPDLDSLFMRYYETGAPAP